MTELRRHYDEVGQHLVAFETKFASMKLDPQEMRELKKVNAKQTNEIGKLKAKVGKLEKDLLEAKMDASMSEQAARKENAAREEESQRKEEAEARLNKLLEAHKRMTTMFSGI
jgi:septal ring factor EnvC (AmiA/AmiB activator)